MPDIAHDDLTRPLGMAPPKPAARRLWPTATRWLVLGLAVAAVAGVWVVQRRAADSGSATVEIKRIPMVSNEFTGSVPQSGQPSDEAPPVRAPEKPVVSAEELEEAAGVKVVRGHGVGAPPSVVIQVPDERRIRLTAAPDRRVSEKSAHGTLPRVAANGARPAEIYARPAAAEPVNRVNPRIAIIVGSLGVNRQGTADAVAKLPGEITLAFAPYGEGIAAQVARARDQGHEVLLQAPMEPFDYPANDPGPHTLRTAVDEADNRDKLHWLMARFPGYVGVTNFLGAKFTADPASLQPVLREIGQRGLIFVDDGSSARSVVREIAPQVRLEAVTADVVIDATANAAAIDKALARLEEIARSDGIAVGTATASPMSVARIARFAEAAKGRGVTLVPVSAVVSARRRG